MIVLIPDWRLVLNAPKAPLEVGPSFVRGRLSLLMGDLCGRVKTADVIGFTNELAASAATSAGSFGCRNLLKYLSEANSVICIESFSSMAIIERGVRKENRFKVGK